MSKCSSRTFFVHPFTLLQNTRYKGREWNDYVFWRGQITWFGRAFVALILGLAMKRDHIRVKLFVMIHFDGVCSTHWEQSSNLVRPSCVLSMAFVPAYLIGQCWVDGPFSVSTSSSLLPSDVRGRMHPPAGGGVDGSVYKHSRPAACIIDANAKGEKIRMEDNAPQDEWAHQVFIDCEELQEKYLMTRCTYENI